MDLLHCEMLCGAKKMACACRKGMPDARDGVQPLILDQGWRSRIVDVLARGAVVHDKLLQVDRVQCVIEGALEGGRRRVVGHRLVEARQLQCKGLGKMLAVRGVVPHATWMGKRQAHNHARRHCANMRSARPRGDTRHREREREPESKRGETGEQSRETRTGEIGNLALLVGGLVEHREVQQVVHDVSMRELQVRVGVISALSAQLGAEAAGAVSIKRTKQSVVGVVHEHR